MKIPSFVPEDALKEAIIGRRARRRWRPAGGVSRRRFIGGAATAAGGVFGLPLFHPRAAWARKATDSAPNPIPGGVTVGGTLFHVTFFGRGVMPAVINDFNGFVGVAEVQGTGTATNADGSTETLLFDTDMRFMKGVYVGKDGAVHNGTFGFV
jgi:hypothetical protein